MRIINFLKTEWLFIVFTLCMIVALLQALDSPNPFHSTYSKRLIELSVNGAIVYQGPIYGESTGVEKDGKIHVDVLGCFYRLCTVKSYAADEVVMRYLDTPSASLHGFSQP